MDYNLSILYLQINYKGEGPGGRVVCMRNFLHFIKYITILVLLLYLCIYNNAVCQCTLNCLLKIIIMKDVMISLVSVLHLCIYDSTVTVNVH